MNTAALNHSVEYIKSWLQFQYDREDILGYVVAIAHKGKIVMNEAYGYADLEHKVRLTPQHIFRIASHSKTFTATSLMQLQEQGKLRIDDYVVDYLPWLRNHSDRRWQKVTLRQLMSHGAGVIRDGQDADYWALDCPFPDEEALKQAILKADLVIDTNTKLKYSNFGYSLLGMVIRAASGVPYAEYVREHIVTPLGLQDTGPEYEMGIEARIVTGYTRGDIDKRRLPIAQIDTHAMASATGFYSTSEDLCRYFAAHVVGSGKLLDDESKKEMQRVQWHAKTPGQHNHEDYGLGLEIEFIGDRRAFGHGGGFPGQSTLSFADSKDELVVVVLTNCIDGPVNAMMTGIYGILDYFQQNEPEHTPKHDMRRLEGRYMGLWSINDIVVTGDKVVSAYPNCWWPLGEPEGLEFVDDTTLKITNTGSFGSEDELVRFTCVNDAVESVNYAGFTLYPEAAWIEMQRTRTIVGQQTVN